ncbi:protein LLP homolog [Procambarus clarkii]|uniref:protein LLP homolog n=1 Tax=Procambarus clarkii TaxID=6728 RepID=UPI001E67306B|nr:protein LLP homolog [Procambarus clarkii]
MAKSLRSKWIRKCKREKRIRYGKKELASLLKVVEKAQGEVEIKDAVEVVRSAKKETDPSAGEAMEASSSSEEKQTKLRAELDIKKIIKKFGTAPKWMHPRKVKKIRKQMAVEKSKKKNKK